MGLGVAHATLHIGESGVCKRNGKLAAGAGKAEPRETVYFTWSALRGWPLSRARDWSRMAETACGFGSRKPGL